MIHITLFSKLVKFCICGTNKFSKIVFTVLRSRRLMPRMHCSRRLIVQTLVFSRSYLHRQVFPPETVVLKGELLGREMVYEFCLKMPDFDVTFRDLLHAVNQRHGTDGFTSLPKEGVLRIFSTLKNPKASAGF